MRKIGLIADVSFVYEEAGDVYLISYYGYCDAPKVRPPGSYMDLPGMKEYQDVLAPFFGDNKQVRIPPANSFWIQAKVEDTLGASPW